MGEVAQVANLRARKLPICATKLYNSRIDYSAESFNEF
jgi:hypothetical protein